MDKSVNKSVASTKEIRTLFYTYCFFSSDVKGDLLYGTALAQIYI